jgi:hypothetical protein
VDKIVDTVHTFLEVEYELASNLYISSIKDV